jgi:DNA primase
MGGVQAVAKTYWKSIAGRSVLLWPDNDEPGRLAMFAVAEALKPLGCRIKHIDVKPEDGDKGQDIADLEPLGRDHVEKYMRERIKVLQYATNDANV